jgi:hypothetical protein
VLLNRLSLLEIIGPCEVHTRSLATNYAEQAPCSAFQMLSTVPPYMVPTPKGLQYSRYRWGEAALIGL